MFNANASSAFECVNVIDACIKYELKTNSETQVAEIMRSLKIVRQKFVDNLAYSYEVKQHLELHTS